MNNLFKKSVVASLALALVSLNSLNAKGTTCCSKPVNPIVGTWNVELQANPARGQEPEEQQTLLGVITFHSDKNVDIQIEPVSPVAGFFNDNDTQGLGLWKQTGNGKYQVLLSSVAYFSDNPTDSRRYQWDINLDISDLCTVGTIDGTFNERRPNDLCFEGAFKPLFDLKGDICKLTFCPAK